MLEWTGERFLPWLEHSTIAYEHLHRYAYAARFAKGKRVLDLASGEGYGSKMLAETASSVIGVDIDDNAVQHAKSKYGSATLQFITGSISALPIKEDHSFDIIVCFEAIEHIEDHDGLLDEVKRLLTPDGTFIVSTPNKRIYHDEARDENPFHLKELYFEDFKQLLGSHFKTVRFLGQRIHPGSSIWPMEAENDSGIEEFVVERGEAEFQFIPNERRVPLYFIAIASDSAASVRPPGSVLLDHSDGLIREGTQAVAWRDQQLEDRYKTISALEDALKWREDQIGAREKTIESLEMAIRWHEEQIKTLSEAAEWAKGHIAHMEQKIASHEEALAWRADQVDTLEKEKTALITHLQNTQRQLGLAREQLEAIHASSGWKFVLKVRHVRDSLKNLIGLGKSRA